jgi:hypothetical protein
LCAKGLISKRVWAWAAKRSPLESIRTSCIVRRWFAALADDFSGERCDAVSDGAGDWTDGPFGAGRCRARLLAAVFGSIDSATQHH